MTWWAVGVAAATAIASAYQQNEVAEDKDRAASQAIAAQRQKQNQASKQINEAVLQMQQSNADDEKASAQQSYIDTLRLGQQADGINQGVGAFSDAYREDAANDAQAVSDYGTSRAGLLARIDAPRLQRQNEGIIFSDAANALNETARQSAQQSYIDQLRLNSIQADPWVSAGLQVAGSYGQSKAASG